MKMFGIAISDIFHRELDSCEIDLKKVLSETRLYEMYRGDGFRCVLRSHICI